MESKRELTPQEKQYESELATLFEDETYDLVQLVETELPGVALEKGSLLATLDIASMFRTGPEILDPLDASKRAESFRELIQLIVADDNQSIGKGE